jgi:hypothetical protein
VAGPATELPERDIQGVVERRPSVRGCLLHGLLEPRPIGGQLLDNLHPVGKGDDRSPVARAERAEEIDGCFLNDRHLVAHARARVQHQDQIHGNQRGLEEADLLFHAILEDGEIVAGKVGDEAPLADVHDADVEGDEAGATAEDGVLGLPGPQWDG